MFFSKSLPFSSVFPYCRAPQWSAWWLFKPPEVGEWLMDYMAVSCSLPEATANSSNESSCHYCFLSASRNCPGPHLVHPMLPCSHFNKSPLGPPQMSFWSSTTTMSLVMKTGGHARGLRKQEFLVSCTLPPNPIPWPPSFLGGREKPDLH